MFDFNEIITFDRILENLPEHATKLEAFLAQRNRLAENGKIYKCPTSRVVVTGVSDHSVTEEMHRALKHVVDVWYTTNKQTPNVRGIPIGVYDLAAAASLWKAMNMPRENRGLVYMNFTIDNNIDKRRPVWDMFKDKPWVTVGKPVPQDEFFVELRGHRFCLCPAGNGVDTYRIWESIYAGTIPIVMYNFAHSDWVDLPILFVNDWAEVTPEFLATVDMTGRSVEKAKLSYWIQQIKQSRPPRPTRYASLGFLPRQYTASSPSQRDTSSPP
jgi:hypothetical protein